MTAEDYIRQVEWALGDLPWSQRRDLLADLRNHLAELPPENDLVQRLGTPERYASDLRAAEGLERRHGPIAWLRARRPRNLALVVIALCLLGLAIGALAWIHTYQPIATGTVGFEPGAHDSPTGDGIYYVFHQGRRFRFGMTIENDGRFTVRVLGVPIYWELPVRYRLLVSGPGTIYHGPPPGRFKPLHPFDLAPGEQRMILFNGRFSEPCDLRQQGSQGFGEIPVHYRFLWHTGTAQVALPEPLTFVFTKNAATGCPARH
jgi:hypothetical protein